MSKLPVPPTLEQLADLQPAKQFLSAGTWIWRIYFREPPGRGGWNAFRAFGPIATARFDHHLPPARTQDRQIMYAALEPTTCIAEVFQRTRRVHRTFKQPWLVGIAIERDLQLLDLTRSWPTAAGASMALNSGRRDRARAWSRAIYEAYGDIDGLLCGSSMHANLPSLALYERSVDAMPVSPFFHRALSDPVLTTTIVNAAVTLRYVVI